MSGDFLPLPGRERPVGKGARRPFARKEMHFGAHLIKGIESQIPGAHEKPKENSHDRHRHAAARNRKRPVVGAPLSGKTRRIAGSNPGALRKLPALRPVLRFLSPQLFKPGGVERRILGRDRAQGFAALQCAPKKKTLGFLFVLRKRIDVGRARLEPEGDRLEVVAGTQSRLIGVGTVEARGARQGLRVKSGGECGKAAAAGSVGNIVGVVSRNRRGGGVGVVLGRIEWSLAVGFGRND